MLAPVFETGKKTLTSAEFLVYNLLEARRRRLFKGHPVRGKQELDTVLEFEPAAAVDMD